jgi:hypothetical protein
MIGRGVLVGAESLDIDTGSIARQGRELLPGDKPTSPTQRNQLSDPMTVARDSEGLPMLDRIHDLSRSTA